MQNVTNKSLKAPVFVDLRYPSKLSDIVICRNKYQSYKTDNTSNSQNVFELCYAVVISTVFE